MARINYWFYKKINKIIKKQSYFSVFKYLLGVSIWSTEFTCFKQLKVLLKLYFVRHMIWQLMTVLLVYFIKECIQLSFPILYDLQNIFKIWTSQHFSFIGLSRFQVNLMHYFPYLRAFQLGLYMKYRTYALLVDWKTLQQAI